LIKMAPLCRISKHGSPATYYSSKYL